MFYIFHLDPREREGEKTDEEKEEEEAREV
ncbi:hypothetical protein OIU74_016839 [Salix koriyanagi]|uniref:Uncharacterized protein n=1 Tax=Salix koriyanagi TaxID=2511006 RepID=A0A9Q0SS93_9ROSI|nr:hypothetical protein OIU74_016839 [Salix koriyanagi]